MIVMSKFESFTSPIPVSVNRQPLETVVIHFAGDSGDGMQLAGSQFTQSSAALGNDIRTFPDFPAEIRAPQGTVPGVSGFQLSFSEHRIYTPGDRYDVLVAMNPAALKQSIKNLEPGGLLIVDEDKFNDKELKKAGYAPDDDPFAGIAPGRVIRIPMVTLTLEALKDLAVTRPQARKCKNMFALGVVYWLYHRPLEETKEWLKGRFKDTPAIQEANITALRTGYHYAITAELFAEHYTVKAADLPKGTYRQMTGNQALAWGVIAAGQLAQKSVMVCGYPITPASDILHILAKYPEYGIKIFQAEDEMGAVGAAIGASFAGELAITSTSGPGLDLKQEALGLAVMTELPLVVVDVQRAGPSTGMPTKVEQSDLLAALYGRHGECPIPILAPSTPSECFDVAIQAFKIATQFMTPVIILSDAYLANSAEPWKIPDVTTLPEFTIKQVTESCDFMPYKRDPESLARPWAIPGTPELMHRIGGLETEDETGNISYDADNHQRLVDLRAEKIQVIAQHLPEAVPYGATDAETLVIGWGSTFGAIQTAIKELNDEHHLIAGLQLTALNPWQPGLEQILSQYKTILVVELNTGQLCQLLRAAFLVDAQSIQKVAGKPFGVHELKSRILPHLSLELSA